MVQACAQRLVGLRRGQVHALVLEQGREALEFFWAWPLGQFDLGEAFLHQGAVLRVFHGVPAHADDAAACRKAAVTKRLEQRRHQFAPSEIARTSEQNEIKAHGVATGKNMRDLKCNLVSSSIEA